MKKINTTFANFSRMALSRGEMKLIMGGVGEEPGTEFGSCTGTCSVNSTVYKCVSVKLGTKTGCTCQKPGGIGCQ
ncbi:hypothetical protein HNQ91_001220 [Filimonas zeae]|uniref:Uncharacterized protein n=1 Tax=Filimonas zeae TaxID=1737353 RepID=A0A917IRF8_9BACT|nr:hypothetical protein [Filimonas zeae]MDR6338198.1 hypothetical protein [Filimonas zeae]GGH62197.1 hypothetical protein GCM10011379_11940 [Filimonas zeae]